jgi:hypothetical protein
MFYVSVYLYIMGCALMWWWARAQIASLSSKILATILWPIMVPFAALFYSAWN